MSETNQNALQPMIFQEEIQLRPIGRNVIIEPEDYERKTKSGLILAGPDRSKPLVGRVVSIGESEQIPVKPGDRVIFHRYEGTEIRSGVKPAVLILELDDILAVVEIA